MRLFRQRTPGAHACPASCRTRGLRKPRRSAPDRRSRKLAGIAGGFGVGQRRSHDHRVRRASASHSDAGVSARANGNGERSARADRRRARRSSSALDEALQKFQAQKRWSDVIKTTLEKAELVAGPGEKVALFAEAGRMYLERSSNQAEAIKCYRARARLRSAQPRGDRSPQGHVREAPRLGTPGRGDARRVRPARRAATARAPARARAARDRAAAQADDLHRAVAGRARGRRRATPKRSTRSRTCTSARASGRRWPTCSSSKSAVRRATRPSSSQLLQKLGTIYADKLNDDHGAIDAFKRLLELEPDDRRAQEQLKKRYVTRARVGRARGVLRRRRGKCDELIRTFERAADAKDSRARGAHRAAVPRRAPVAGRSRTRPIAPRARTRRC